MKSQQFLMAMLLLSINGQASASFETMDKSGKYAVAAHEALTQVLNQQEPADAGSETAERKGFEPLIPLRAYRFSRPTHSTALPPLRFDSDC